MFLVLHFFVLLPVTVAQNFCNVQGKYVKEIPNAIHGSNKEVSGLALNADRTFFFTMSDSPEGDPLIFVTTNTGSPSRAATIRITGVTNINFNGGYGDWESVVSYKCSADPSKRCIVVGDIGHNKVRDKGGVLRSSAQSVRFIEVEEPSSDQLRVTGFIDTPGKEYTFSYPGGGSFDAEAMVVKDDRLFVISKNSASYKFSHMFEVPNMVDGVELVEKAIFQVKYSEVTGAASSPGYLILRTYIGLNFYKWDALCDDTVRTSKVYQSIDFLKSGKGLQEAVEYDASNRNMYLAGEGSSTLYYMQCVPAAASTSSPVFGDLCLDDFDGAASLASSASSVYRLRCSPVLTLILAIVAWSCS